MSIENGVIRNRAAHPDEIMSCWNREILSQNATKLYEAIWYRMRNCGRSDIWLSDDEASRRARVLVQYIPSARAELVNLNLLQCLRGIKEWQYTYLEQVGPEYDDEIGAAQ